MSQNEVASIIHSLREIVQGLRTSSHRAETAIGMSGAQLFVLQKIYESSLPLSLGEIADLTLTHISSVSVVVKKLHEGGFVKKSKASDDQRRSVISLTDKGKKQLAKQPESVQQALIAAVKYLSALDQRKLAGLLREVTEKAHLTQAKVPMFFEEPKI